MKPLSYQLKERMSLLSLSVKPSVDLLKKKKSVDLLKFLCFGLTYLDCKSKLPSPYGLINQGLLQPHKCKPTWLHHRNPNKIVQQRKILLHLQHFLQEKINDAIHYHIHPQVKSTRVRRLQNAKLSTSITTQDTNITDLKWSSTASYSQIPTLE